MTVFRNKQRGGEWRYDFWLNKERFSNPCLDESGLPVTTKTAALAAEERERVAARQRQNLARSGIRAGSYTLARAAALHLSRVADKKPKHFANHKLYVREICDVLGAATAMIDLTDHDIERYRTHAAAQTNKKWIGGVRRRRADPGADDQTNPAFWKDTGKPRSKRTVNNYLRCLRKLIAIAEKVRDPVTRLPIPMQPLEVKLHKVPKRLPRPIGDDELYARLDVARPWTREAAELSRLFALRKGECFWVDIRHIYHEAGRNYGGLRFDAGESKSGNDELVHGGIAGWDLLMFLADQARARGQTRLITWPGPKLWRAMLRGEEIPREAWRPLKSVTKSWKRTVKAAEVEHPHRFHDIRARAITEVAKVMPAAAQGAARHQDPATTSLYIGLASTEIADAVEEAVAKRPARIRLKVVK